MAKVVAIFLNYIKILPVTLTAFRSIQVYVQNIKASQRENRKGNNNAGTQGKRHATAVVTLPSFLLFYVKLQIADLIAERAFLSHEGNLPRTSIVEPRPGASAADQD